jgi:hypothetical protein
MATPSIVRTRTSCGGERDAMRRIRDRFGEYDGRFDDDC